MRKGFVITAVLLILVTVFCVRGTVLCKESDERATANRYYAALEDEYREEVRRTLEEQGYDDCGITMTRVTAADGSREYKVLLHHRKFEKLTTQEKNAVTAALSEMEFGDGVCKFWYEL